jgi:hypothetical protein
VSGPPTPARLSVLAGLASTLAAGSTPALLGALGILGVLTGWRSASGPVSAAAQQRWQVGTALIVLFGMFAAIGLAVPWGQVGLGLVVWLSVNRAWVGRSPAEHRVGLLLSLLALLVSATLTRSLWMGLAIAGWAVTAPAALLRLQLDDEPGSGEAPLGGLLALGPIGLLVAFVVFLFLPRLQAGLMAVDSEVQDVSGFSDRVELGQLGAIKDNPRLVLRAEVRTLDGGAPEGPFYFRGMALDSFDGQRWISSWRARKRELTAQAPRDPQPGDLEQRILLEPLGEPLVFALPRLTAADVEDTFIFNDGLFTYRFSAPPRRVEYTAWSRPPRRDPAQLAREKPLPPGFAEHFTALPPDLDPRIPELAAQITAGATTADEKARAISGWLRSELDYTLVPDPEMAGQPLAWFLFERRAGHCEYFATALAVMLRSVGVPAVLVTGFYGGEWNAIGGYWQIRQADAHSWVEAHVGEAGWLDYDATPAGATAPGTSSLLAQASDVLVGWWYSQILDYDIQSQLELSGEVARALGAGVRGQSSAPGALSAPRAALLPLTVLVITGFLAARALPAISAARRSRPGATQRVHQRAWRLARRRGWTPPPQLPAVEAAAWLEDNAGPSAAPMKAIAWLYYRARFGGEPDEALAACARRHLAELRELEPRAD